MLMFSAALIQSPFLMLGVYLAYRKSRSDGF